MSRPSDIYIAYSGIQVTLTSSATAYNLLALLQAVDSRMNNGTCRELDIQNDPANAASYLYVGDSSISATRYGYSLPSGGSRTYRDLSNSLPISEIWVWSTINNLLVNVEIM